MHHVCSVMSYFVFLIWRTKVIDNEALGYFSANNWMRHKLEWVTVSWQTLRFLNLQSFLFFLCKGLQVSVAYEVLIVWTSFVILKNDAYEMELFGQLFETFLSSMILGPVW